MRSDVTATLLPPKRASSWRWLLPGEPEEEAAARWWLLFPLLLPQFAGIAVALPILPQLKLQFFGSAASAARAQGAAASLRAALTFTVSSELGRVSDAMGRKPLLLLSVLCTLAPLLTLRLTGDVSIYLILFALAGAMGGQSTPGASAYVADCCPPEQQARNYGMLGAAIGGTFMLGPVVGVWLESVTGQQGLLNLVIALEVLAVAVALLLPESLVERKQWRGRAHRCSLRAAFRPLASLPEEHGKALQRLVLLRLILAVAWAGLDTVLSFSLVQLAGFTDADFGFQMSMAGMASVVGQAIFLPLLLKAGLTEQHLLLLSLTVNSLQLTAWVGLLGWWPRKPFIFGMTLVGACGNFWTPAFTALVTKMLTQDRGLVLGVFGAIDGLAAVAAPPVFSLVFAAGPLWPMVAAALLACSGLLLASLTFSAEEVAEDNVVEAKCTAVAEDQSVLAA